MERALPGGRDREKREQQQEQEQEEQRASEWKRRRGNGGAGGGRGGSWVRGPAGPDCRLVALGVELQCAPRGGHGRALPARRSWPPNRRIQDEIGVAGPFAELRPGAEERDCL